MAPKKRAVFRAAPASWSVEEDAVLHKARRSGTPIADLLKSGVLPGRSKKSIYKRLSTLRKSAPLGEHQTNNDFGVDQEPLDLPINPGQAPDALDYVKQCLEEEAAAREKADALARQRFAAFTSRKTIEDTFVATPAKIQPVNAHSTPRFLTRPYKSSPGFPTGMEISDSEESADEEINRSEPPGISNGTPPPYSHQPVYQSQAAYRRPSMAQSTHSNAKDSVLFSPSGTKRRAPPSSPPLLDDDLDLNNVPVTQPSARAAPAVEVPRSQPPPLNVEATRRSRTPSVGRRHAIRTDLDHLKPTSIAAPEDKSDEAEATSSPEEAKAASVEVKIPPVKVTNELPTPVAAPTSTAATTPTGPKPTAADPAWVQSKPAPKTYTKKHAAQTPPAKRHKPGEPGAWEAQLRDEAAASAQKQRELWEEQRRLALEEERKHQHATRKKWRLSGFPVSPHESDSELPSETESEEESGDEVKVVAEKRVH